MSRISIFAFILFISLGLNKLHAQKMYTTASGELIFSCSNAAYTQPDAGENLMYGNSEGSISDNMRFTIWFHLYINWHIDFNKYFGLFTGIGNRNIGFITYESSSEKDENSNAFYSDKWKRRSYALGVPLALKIGNLEKGYFLYFGGQYEWLYHYKEKEFKTTGKRKQTEWFSDRTTQFLPSLFVGVTFPHGLSIKFTYALNDFMNKSYTDDAGNQPYKYMDSKIMYISVFNFIRWEKEVHEISEKKESRIAWY